MKLVVRLSCLSWITFFLLFFRIASNVETTVKYWLRRLGEPWAKTGRQGSKAEDLPAGQSCKTIIVLLKPWSGCLAPLLDSAPCTVLSTIFIPAGAIH